MVINFILPALGTSGGIDVVYKYVDLFLKAGHDVCVYKEIKARNMHRYKSPIKNKVHQVYCTMKGIIYRKNNVHPCDCIVWKINEQTIRKADAIIATAWPTAFVVSNLPDKCGLKYYFIQDYEIWDNKELVKQSYRLPLRKIVISSWINNCLKKDMGIGPFPIVYNGLDLEMFHKSNVHKNNQEIGFLMLNHILPKKGVTNGLKVFEAIRLKYPQAKLRMFGMCDRRNLPSYVEYYQNPSKKEIVNLYSMSDIFIFPSIEEGWGLTPLEAMACGCVVVGTETGFVLDFGKNNYNMMISKPNDLKRMIYNIEELLEKDDLKNKISENALKDIGILDWKKSCDSFINCILNYENLNNMQH